MDIFQQSLSEAEENSTKLNKAALDIQRVYRGVIDREIIVKKNYAAGEIQRIFRGLMGRFLARATLNQKLDGRQISLFHYLCIQIQKCFRGYYSRKYKHDQVKRKEYCKMLEAKGKEIRASMDKYVEEVAMREEIEQQEKRDQEFKTLAQNLHHLTSTRQVPGVYNPRVDCVQMPTMNGIFIEDHIRGVVKDLLRTRGLTTHRGLEEDINGTMRIPLKGLKYRLSIQASEPYDTVEREARRKHMLHKILTRGKGDWFAGGKPKLLEKTAPLPLSTGDVYMDPWANPMLVKGVPESQQQLLESTRTHKALFATKKLSQPYYTRVGGNKSTALPNDVFDTMADAQETGGAAQRQKGLKTSRFGLSENCDCRTDGVLPAAPLRTTMNMRASRSLKSRSYKFDTSLKAYVPMPSEKDLVPTTSSNYIGNKSKNSLNGRATAAAVGRVHRSIASNIGDDAIDEVESVMTGGDDDQAFGNNDSTSSVGGGVLYPADDDSSDDEG